MAIYVCDCEIKDGKVEIINKSGVISQRDFNLVVEEFKDKLLYIEGEDTHSYDNSDDERASCHSSKTPFGRYYEIDFESDSQHLIRINGKIVGVIFHVKDGYNVDYYPFLFDGSIKRMIRLGYSASHSSSYTYVEKVSLLKRGEKGAPESARMINFKQSKMYPSF